MILEIYLRRSTRARVTPTSVLRFHIARLCAENGMQHVYDGILGIYRAFAAAPAIVRLSSTGSAVTSLRTPHARKDEKAAALTILNGPSSTQPAQLLEFVAQPDTAAAAGWKSAGRFAVYLNDQTYGELVAADRRPCSFSKLVRTVTELALVDGEPVALPVRGAIACACTREGAAFSFGRSSTTSGMGRSPKRPHQGTSARFSDFVQGAAQRRSA